MATTKTTSQTSKSIKVIDKSSTINLESFTVADFPILEKFGDEFIESVKLPIMNATGKVKLVDFNYTTNAKLNNKFNKNFNYKLSPIQFGFIVREMLPVPVYFDNPVTIQNDQNKNNYIGTDDKTITSIDNDHIYNMIVKMKHIIKLKNHVLIPKSLTRSSNCYIVNMFEFESTTPLKFKNKKFKYINLK